MILGSECSQTCCSNFFWGPKQFWLLWGQRAACASWHFLHSIPAPAQPRNIPTVLNTNFRVMPFEILPGNVYVKISSCSLFWLSHHLSVQVPGSWPMMSFRLRMYWDSPGSWMHLPPNSSSSGTTGWTSPHQLRHLLILPPHTHTICFWFSSCCYSLSYTFSLSFLGTDLRRWTRTWDVCRPCSP